MPRTSRLLLVLALVATAAACGSSADDDQASSSGGDGPTVVVTTSILGDVVGDLVGDTARVVVLMPAGADPHDFQASARDVAEMREADVLVTNGGGFEVGLADAIAAAEDAGVPTIHALDLIDDPLAFTEHAGHDHGDEAHEAHEADEAVEAEGDDHDDEPLDPHFFTDPARMAEAAEGIAAALRREAPGAAVDDGIVDELTALDAEVEDTLAAVPAERRVLVTGHDVFGYFADRYDFEVVGVVVPGGGTGAEPSAADLDALATVIDDEDVPAIFVDSSAPARLADALAAEVGEVEVVALFTESLGAEGSGGETYPDMVRTNAERIADALG